VPKGLSRRKYAEHRGVSETAVRKAIKKGTITTQKDGTIDPAIADRQWEKNTDPTKPLNSVTGNPKHRKESPDAPSDPMLGKGNGQDKDPIAGYAKIRAARELYQMRLTKLEWEQKVGDHISREEVVAGARAAGQELTNKLLGFPGLVAPLVAGMDVRACRTVLTKEVRRILEDLKKTIDRAASPRK
jgi:hypothetical protein